MRINVKHGHNRSVEHDGNHSPTYKSWNMMLQRCTNPNYDKYRYYGGRGITVCDRWRNFEQFLADMGVRPNGRTLDRIDNNSNYEPSNCRWATKREQSLNSRGKRWLTYEGRTQTVTDWGRELGIPPTTLFKRLRIGYSLEQSIAHPEKLVKQVCINGHPFVLGSFWVFKRGGKEYRRCKICQKASTKRYLSHRKAEAGV